MAVLTGLEPKSVLENFEWLSSVPHGSGNTAQIVELLVSFAEKHDLKYVKDELGNIVMFKPGTKGYENSEPVMLQGHSDMVCVKLAESPKDMAVDPIDMVTDGEWIWADKTTLGADNAIGCALALAILESIDIAHPPIEAVFTVDEEIGLVGAKAMDCSCLKSKKMINLDCGPEGKYVISCAGNITMDFDIPVGRMTRMAEGFGAYHIQVGGLKGGHSGGTIHEGRCNAIQLMARTLKAAMEEIPELRLLDIAGGMAMNAIPSKVDAVAAIPAGKVKTLNKIVKAIDEAAKVEYQVVDPDVYVGCEKIDDQGLKGLSVKDTAKIVNMLLSVPYNVQRMSPSIPNLPETSANPAVINMKEKSVQFVASIRSASNTEKEAVFQRFRAAILPLGATVTTSGDFPAWPYVEKSPIRELVTAEYKAQTGNEPVIVATHGGLECGLFIDKIPGLDAVAMGALAEGAHTPKERVNIASVGRTFELLKTVLGKLK